MKKDKLTLIKRREENEVPSLENLGFHVQTHRSKNFQDNERERSIVSAHRRG